MRELRLWMGVLGLAISAGACAGGDGDSTETSGFTSGPASSSTAAMTAATAPTSDPGTSSEGGTTAGTSGSTSDDATTDDPSTRSTTDPPPACGDGSLDEGEECDEGEDNAYDADCTPTCALAVCGDDLTHAEDEE